MQQAWGKDKENYDIICLSVKKKKRKAPQLKKGEKTVHMYTDKRLFLKNIFWTHICYKVTKSQYSKENN